MLDFPDEPDLRRTSPYSILQRLWSTQASLESIAALVRKHTATGLQSSILGSKQEFRPDVRADDLTGHHPHRFFDEHLARAVHRDDLARVNDRKLRYGAPGLGFGARPNEMEATDHCVDFRDSRDRLRLPDRVDDAAAAARCDHDKAKILHDVEGRQLVLAVIRKLGKGRALPDPARPCRSLCRAASGSGWLPAQNFAAEWRPWLAPAP